MTKMTKAPDARSARLLALLRENARMPVSELARRLNLSRGAVTARLNQLVASGTILGFTTRIRAAAQADIQAFFLIRFEPGLSCAQVVPRLIGLLEICQIHALAGEWDLILRASVPDTDRLSTLRERIGATAGVAEVKTHSVLAEHLSREG